MRFHPYLRQLCLLTGVALVLFAADTALPPLNWTAAQDHQNMMDQLGIKALRPGPSGQTAPGTPNMANYDPAKANPYPDIPDALTLKNGKKVTTAMRGGSSGGRRSWKISIARFMAASRRMFLR